MAPKNSVLYHDDWDGICAACVARNHLPRDTEYQAVQHKQPVPWKLVDGRRVWIFDFSYPREQMEEIIERADEMTCIDHHSTAQEALKGLDGCHFNMDHSGARLVYDFFRQNAYEFPSRAQFPKKLVDYVEDRDLWAWKLPRSKEINAVIGSYPLTFEAWAELIKRFKSRGGLRAMAKEGGPILRNQSTKIASMMLHSAKPVKFGKHTALVVNTPLYHSEVAGELAEQDGYDFGVTWFQGKDGLVQLSFRSRGKFDVSKVAKEFGGGGHKNASGAKVEPDSDAAKALFAKPAEEKKNRKDVYTEAAVALRRHLKEGR